nr:hypothetical protein NG677_04515 [Methylobacterium sp. OTU13CASTA1]
MLSPSDKAFVAAIDVPSLRQTVEQVARPHCEAVEDMRATFTEVPAICGRTRVALAHESAKADDLSTVIRLFRALESDPAGTLAALGRALIADEASGRPSAAVVPLRVVPRAPARPGIFARTMMALGRPAAEPAPTDSLPASERVRA